MSISTMPVPSRYFGALITILVLLLFFFSFFSLPFPLCFFAFSPYLPFLCITTGTSNSGLCNKIAAWATFWYYTLGLILSEIRQSSI